MSKFIIAVDEDVEMIDGKQYDTLEEAKTVAARVLKRLQDDNYKTIAEISEYDDEISGRLYDEDEHIDKLVVLEINPATLPDFGYMIFDGLEDYSISEGNPDEEWPGATIKDVDELNDLVSAWMKDKGYNPNWYNIGETYLVSAEGD